MLDQLLASPQLRQEASEKLLEIAKFLSVDELAEQYEQALCQFLSPEVRIRLLLVVGHIWRTDITCMGLTAWLWTTGPELLLLHATDCGNPRWVATNETGLWQCSLDISK
jgi:hypothetical protein